VVFTLASFGCTAHFGQTAEVKLKLCLKAYLGSGGMLWSAENHTTSGFRWLTFSACVFNLKMKLDSFLANRRGLSQQDSVTLFYKRRVRVNL